MVSHSPAAQPANLPRLVDLGADTCIPCKAMAPILVELRAEYDGRMRVDFIDVWKDPGAGEPYGIYAIPTQIFFDADGKELTRHEGFFSKADILATWKRFGYDFSPPGAASPRN
jgi:thioredoxin 1